MQDVLNRSPVPAPVQGTAGDRTAHATPELARGSFTIAVAFLGFTEADRTLFAPDHELRNKQRVSKTGGASTVN